MGSKKKRKGIVFSTDPDFDYRNNDGAEAETLPPGEQLLYVSLDRKRRKGKTVTLIEGFTGSTDDLKSLEKSLKSRCGVGGSAKDGEIILQGDLKIKVRELLEKEGYQVKLKG